MSYDPYHPIDVPDGTKRIVLRQRGDNQKGAEVRTEGGPWVVLDADDIDTLVRSLEALRELN